MDEIIWPRYLPAGDSAILVEFANQMDPEINRRVHALANRIQSETVNGLGETIPGYRSLLVIYDPCLLSFDRVVDFLQKTVQSVQDQDPTIERLVEIPVLFGGQHGPDLASLAEYHQLNEEEVVGIFTAQEYRVYMIGFTPGFPYLGDVDDRIATPRLPVPRTRVPAGSVGIAGKQTGIYPINSPGGWQIIGFTPLPLFDLDKNPPSFLSPGDRVRFVAVKKERMIR